MAILVAIQCSCKFTLHQNRPPARPKTSISVQKLEPMSISNRVNRSNSKSLKTSTDRKMPESGSLKNALKVFDNMSKPSTFACNSVIMALTDEGFYDEAIDFYYKMHFQGIPADNFTFPFVIKACGETLDFMECQKVHSMIIKIGLNLDIYISNSLIVVYAKLGYVEFAKRVFDEMRVRDLVSWNSMLRGYILVGDGWSSLLCFQKMQAFGVGHDRLTIISALNACSLLYSLPTGKEIHGQVIRSNLEGDLMVQTSLIDLYGKSGGVKYAENVFNGIPMKNIVAWNAMIRGYALNEHPFESFACLRKMQEDNVHPDRITLINTVPSCAQISSVLLGKSMHGFAVRMGFLPYLILETAVVDMYGKSGAVKLAELVFSQMSERNLISWNAMIAAHVQNGQYREALKLFQDMWSEPSKPDATTIASILPAYAEMTLLRQGKQIHSYAIKLELSSNTFIMSSIVYMYAKCGDLKTAQEVFDRDSSRDVISWNTIIMAYAFHGLGEMSLRLFSKMKEDGIKPNASTFVSVLSACSIAGIVEEGWEYFVSMKRDYGLDPGVEHYGCIVDLLGRTGDLDKAKQFITDMPLVPTARIWGSLLAASRRHGNLELAEFAAKNVLSLDHDNTGAYILLSNMYAEAGRWEDVDGIQCLMKKKGYEKTIGCCTVILRGRTHRFTNQDRSYHESSLIYDVLDIVMKRIDEEPCVGLSKFKPGEILRRRANSFKSHSSRLAVCFALISTSVGKPVLVKKNTRVCEDCHGVIKEISRIAQREIVVGDAKIYHHFRDGQCSCRDYW